MFMLGSQCQRMSEQLRPPATTAGGPYGSAAGAVAGKMCTVPVKATCDLDAANRHSVLDTGVTHGHIDQDVCGVNLAEPSDDRGVLQRLVDAE